MADDVDRANDYAQASLETALTRRPPAVIPAGRQGECDLCGEWTGRLVNGACAPCRDRYRLD